jgi:hypothetical protein
MLANSVAEVFQGILAMQAACLHYCENAFNESAAGCAVAAAGRGWIPAGMLQIGELLATRDGSRTTTRPAPAGMNLRKVDAEEED